MMSDIENKYDMLSLIQGFAILLTAISVFDLGYAGFVENGIWFNYVLFESDNPTFLQKNTFWDAFQFWGYYFFVVAICQIIKSLPQGFTLRNHSLKFGKLSLTTFFGTPVTALLISRRDYNFKTNALSSLVDYGWIPTVIMSWGVMIAMMSAVIYFYFLEVTQRSDRIAISILLSAAVMFFLVGLTLPKDQPFNHNIFGNFPWYFLSAGIFVYAVPRRQKRLNLFLHAISILIVIFSAGVFHQAGFDLVLWLTQVLFGFLTGMWFYSYEYRKNAKPIEY